MSTEIKNPEVQTWFVFWDDDKLEVKSYGAISSEQHLKSYWSEVDTYTEEQEWIDALAEQDINPYPVEEEEEDDYLITE